jgi:hypothetical protein
LAHGVLRGEQGHGKGYEREDLFHVEQF